MSPLRSRRREMRRVGPLALLGLLVCFLLAGCNGGAIGLAVYFALEDDDDGRSKGPALTTVLFDGLDNARTDPARAVILVRLRNPRSEPATLRIEFAIHGEDSDFQPATLLRPLPGERTARGELSGVGTSPDGLPHEINWDAFADTGGDEQKSVVLRLTALGNPDSPAVERVLVGNDAPRVVDAVCTQKGQGDVLIDFWLTDSAQDLTDIGIEVARLVDDPAEPEFVDPTIEGLTLALETSDVEPGKRHQVRWVAILDRDEVGRRVLFRLTPVDRIDGERGKVGDPLWKVFCFDNLEPRAELLEDELIANPDERRGLPVSVVIHDASADPVDAIVQWSPEGVSFPELPEVLDSDPVARDVLLADADARRRLRVITMRSEIIEGPVEEPQAGLVAEDEIHASWLQRSAELRGLQGVEDGSEAVLPGARLEGKRAELVRADGSRQDRRVVSYAPGRGVLKLERAFVPPAVPGDRLRIDLSDMTRLASRRFGALHRLAWASDADLPGGGQVRLRVTPYDRPPALDLGALGSCQLVGERGDPGGGEEAKTLRGPFGLRVPQTLPLEEVDQPIAIATGDLDGDGRLDVACAARSARALVVFFQTVPGSFDRFRLLDSRVGEPVAMVVEDLDGDGDLDVAVAGESFVRPGTDLTDPPIPPQDKPAQVMLYLQAAGADFISDRALLESRALTFEPAAMVAGDISGEGSIDLVVANADARGSPLVVFTQSGDPLGTGCQDAGDGYRACSIGSAGDDLLRDIEAVDLDADGDLDIAGAGLGGFSLFLNDGSGGFSRIAIDVEGAEFSALALLDLDGDGALDLLGADTSRLVIARQVDVSNYEISEVDLPPGVTEPADLATSDLDQNGWPDLVMASSGIGGALAACLAGQPRDCDGDGAVTTADISCVLFCDVVFSGAGQSLPRSVALGDMEGDGLDDIVLAEDGASRIRIYPQDARARFSQEAAVLDGAGAISVPSGLVGADVDGDGLLDVVSASRSGNDLTLLVQRGADGFDALSFTIDDEAVRGPLAVAAADIDGDGRPDVATANVDSDNVALFLQEGEDDVVFSLRVLESGDLLGPQSIALADLDGDGRLDAITAGRFSDNVVWFRQEEGGDFSAQTLEAAALSAPVAVLAEDLDADGRLDLVVLGHLSANVVRFLQEQGEGAERATFGPGVATTLPPGTLPVAAVARDLDGDGDMDIAVASQTEPVLVVLSQTTPGSFFSQPVSADLGGVVGTALASADLDGDGRLDLVLGSATETDPALNVLLQQKGGFTAVQRVLRSGDLEAPVGVLALDLDGDGEPDLVSANRESATLTVFRGGR